MVVFLTDILLYNIHSNAGNNKQFHFPSTKWLVNVKRIHFNRHEFQFAVYLSESTLLWTISRYPCMWSRTHWRCILGNRLQMPLPPTSCLSKRIRRCLTMAQDRNLIGLNGNRINRMRFFVMDNRTSFIHLKKTSSVVQKLWGSKWESNVPAICCGWVVDDISVSVDVNCVETDCVKEVVVAVDWAMTDCLEDNKMIRRTLTWLKYK